ncbi:cytochrome P450 [Penicillium malachiteum]|uniref:Cytochrome P450 n=1 Tax=Penicillium malachiteum TaxID=1324776 RepID=A0AAD6HC68_9EURO|nr:cytochrome P450 [Penicillium malachiteum]
MTTDEKSGIMHAALKVGAANGLEKNVYDKADLLVQQLGKYKGPSVNISDWVEWFTFDLMAEVGLGLSFTNLESTKANSVISMFRMAHKFIAPLGATPWLTHLFLRIPFVRSMGYYKKFMDWASQEATRSINDANSDRTDLFAYIIEDARKNGGTEAYMQRNLADFLMVFITGR